MKIAFVSSRGIPNNYGGIEQFVEYISVGLAARGHEVTVYSPHYHPYQEKEFKGVRIKHIYSPEKWMGGSVGSFFYDFFSLRDALKRDHFDIIYEAGYTSIIPAFIWYNVRRIKYPIVTTNMDGLEYRRTKFNKWVQKFIFWEERQAVKHSHFLIADNIKIHDYYLEKYGRESKFLPYGAVILDNYDVRTLENYHLTPHNYFILVARIEPENNLTMAIEGYLSSIQYGKRPLIVVGNTTTDFGYYLKKKYESFKSVRFIEGIYDFERLNSLRYYSLAYFHGHSVGGTNPSLLEAMASSCFILAHDNVFNKAVLGENALYFANKAEVKVLLDNIEKQIVIYKKSFIGNNLELIKNEYSWDKLIKEYEIYFEYIYHLNRSVETK